MQGENPVTSINSKSFDVYPGTPFKISFLQSPGAATGGLPFDPFPVLFIGDRGENPVPTVNGYVVECFIDSNTEDAQLYPLDGTAVEIENGYASFKKMYINEAGLFTIRFKTNVPDLEMDTLVSVVLIGIGTPASITFSQELSDRRVLAGEFTTSPPRAELRDAGGNLVRYDSTSAVQVSISIDPVGARILPSENTLAPVEMGIASFSSIYINKAGKGFVLRYTLFSYDRLLNRYTETTVTGLSSRFDVEIGPARLLVTQVKGDLAFAGGQPMFVQPKLSVQDYGKNVLVNDFQSTVSASMMSSLSTSAVITIDTSSATQVAVTEIKLNVSSGQKYGAGQSILFLIKFGSYVSVTGGKPFLALNVLNVHGKTVNATIFGGMSLTRMLQFLYVVAPGDMLSPSNYYLSYDYINSNGSLIVDGNNNAVDVTGKVHMVEQVIIDTSIPTVVSVDIDVEDGVYGVGHILRFFVKYSEQVVVLGDLPFITLNILRDYATTVNNHTFINQSYHGSIAHFSGMTDNSTSLMFLYNVTQADLPTEFPSYVTLGALHDGNVRINATAIKRSSDSPITEANTLIPGVVMATFNNTHKIELDTAAPKLSTTFGVRVNMTDRELYVGDEINLYLQFNKPIVLSGFSMALRVADGINGYGLAPFSRLLSDNKTLEFLYIVGIGANSSSLSIPTVDDALIVYKGVIIRRLSTHPTTNADVNTSQIHSRGLLEYYSGNISTIIINGSPPKVVKVSLNETILNYTFGIGDMFFIAVSFSNPVLVTCSPVLVIQFQGFEREADYYDGNLTTQLKFKYLVALGDSIDQLRYRYLDALCSESGCPVSTCDILGYSMNSLVPADKTLSQENGDPIKGVPFASYSIKTLSKNCGDYCASTVRTTTLKEIKCLSSGEFSAGSLIFFSATFTDAVFTEAGNDPDLYLNIGPGDGLNVSQLADEQAGSNYRCRFFGGSGTNTLTFVYKVQGGDNYDVGYLTVKDTRGMLLGIDPTPFYCVNNAPFYNCSLLNYEGNPVNQTSYGKIIAPNISLYSLPPVVLHVWSTKVTSPYDGYYTIGESIDIFVQFNRDVLVLGVQPSMELDVGNNKIGYAKYQETFGDTLRFEYIVVEGDYSANLKYVSINSFIKSQSTKVLRSSTTPQTEANITLPKPLFLAQGSNTIKILTDVVPAVVSLQTISMDGHYAPGDEVFFRLTFSTFVNIYGSPFFRLNLGNHYSSTVFLGGNMSATSIDPSIPSKIFYFKYVVALGDYSDKLEYVDQFSLFTGMTVEGGPGTIFHTSKIPSIAANLDLPPPGTYGSISNMSSLYVDGEVPYAEKIFFSTNPGNYGQGDTVSIGMNFTVPVSVNGVPSILLATGVLNSYAYYVSGSGSTTLMFEYVVSVGDKTDMLEYFCDQEQVNQARASFNLNGGWIRAASTKPTIDAVILLNPPGGILLGSLDLAASAGNYHYSDLAIRRLGLDYIVKFRRVSQDSLISITTTQEIFVSFSAENLLRPEGILRGDQAGYSSALQDHTAIIGAPNHNYSVYEVQTVTTKVSGSTPLREVQEIGTYLGSRYEIQTFHTSGDVGVTIGGYFRILLGSNSVQDEKKKIAEGPTQSIPANAAPELIKSYLQLQLGVGVVEVSRERYIYCACHNAFIWSITFIDIIRGSFAPIMFDFSSLTGSNAIIVGPHVIQDATFLSGSFTIKAINKESDPIPYNAGSFEMKNALASIGLSTWEVVTVETPDTFITGAKSWLVTFEAFNSGLGVTYDVPLLESNSTGLTGYKAGVWHSVKRNGMNSPSGIDGGFHLTFRNHTSAYIECDASEIEMKVALENVPTINHVDVQRSSPTPLGEYTWTITFKEVLYESTRGFRVDGCVTDQCNGGSIRHESNLEPMSFTNKLVGTNATIVIGASYGTNESFSNWMPHRRGSFGVGAGRVFVFQKIGTDWLEVANIVGDDTAEGDLFGHSLALDDDVLVVGAIGATERGVLERQALSCNATSGSFRLNFRGWTTDFIRYDVDRDQLEQAITADSSSFSGKESIRQVHKLYSVNAIEIGDWGGGGLCDGNTALITFKSPSDGAPNVNNGINDGSNLELLGVESSFLMGTITASSVQNGTVADSGYDASVQNHGAAYVFRRKKCMSDSPCLNDKWTQEAIVYPINPIGGEMFGYSVAVNNGTVAVGCPGCDLFDGQVYVYEYSHGRWSYLQTVKLTGDPLKIGGWFGARVKLSSKNLIVGAPRRPGRDDINSLVQNQGGVFIFTTTSTGKLIELQRLTGYPSNPNYPLTKNDYFGKSFDMNGEFLVIGAYGTDDVSVYLGTSPSQQPSNNTGATYVFKLDSLGNFVFLQKLVPTNVRKNDQFGWDVAVSNQLIIVGAVEPYKGKLVASCPILEVEAVSDYGAEKIGGSFSLKWQVTSRNGIFAEFATPQISFDISAAALKLFLEEHLDTGELIVSRTNVDTLNGGYLWGITFLELEDYLNPFVPITTELTGINPRVEVRIINPTPPKIRGLTHIFMVDNQPGPTSGLFQEVAFVTPFYVQPIDRCGHSVAVSGLMVLVGCPNRDYVVPNNNGGAASIFNLELLSVKFSRSIYHIMEGDTLEINVMKNTEADYDIFFYFETLDRNGPSTLQTFLSRLYGLSVMELSYPSSVADGTGLAGKAMARSQNYGSIRKESIWIDGQYDYRALSDYVPERVPKSFPRYQTSVAYNVTTSADSILESPDESFTIILSSPGVWPSPYGGLFSSVVIQDNSDGMVSPVVSYDKIYLDNGHFSDNIGKEISIDGKANVMAFGSASSTVDNIPHAGRVVIYGRYMSIWVQLKVLSSPLIIERGLYGASVVVSTIHLQKACVLAVGEPGSNSLHIYMSEGSNYGTSFVYDTTLQVNTGEEKSISPSDQFGDSGSLAISNNVIVVGACSLETVYIFQREFDDYHGAFMWKYKSYLRSSDYDYDMMFGTVVLHPQKFGSSVSISGRTIVIGAPYGDYDKSGTDLPEINENTAGSMKSYAKGKAYVFHTLPESQRLELLSPRPIEGGEFKLRLINKGFNLSTSKIGYDTSDEVFKASLKNLDNIDEISLSSSFSGNSEEGFRYIWDITFLSDFNEVPLLLPMINMSGSDVTDIPSYLICSECIPFTSGTTLNVEKKSQLGAWKEKQKLFANDRRSGDRFGISVDIDGEQIAIGADYSAAVSSSSWDFEGGSLTGWSTTGTAFDHQPTFGDNSKHRPSYFGDRRDQLKTNTGSSSGLKGRYYVGTFDKRPGSSQDISVADPIFRQGSSQGNGPTGTMTSDVFMISFLGSKISFLIGGSCDAYTEYVELLIDGFSVARTSGVSCSEFMNRVEFEVVEFKGRAAQLRVVDASSFGHINVDDFQFDWDIRGGKIDDDFSSPFRSIYGGLVDTVQSGAVYVFRRHVIGSLDFCTGSLDDCIWDQEAKVVAADKRSKALFGHSVSISDSAGVLVVGAPRASSTGIFKETPTAYPYMDLNGDSNAVGLQFPISPSNDYELQNLPSFTPQASGARAVWRELGYSHGNDAIVKECGAVYIYTREKAIQSGSGSVTQASHWYSTENFKMTTPDISTRDNFGISSKMDGDMIIIGAHGNDGFSPELGAVYFFHAGFAAVSFSQPEFRVLEGTHSSATVTVLRDVNVFDGALSIEYATSDISAKGVDSEKYTVCLSMAASLRADANCGDYEQTTGVIYFSEGANSGGFEVNVMNDQCRQRFFRYIQLTLSIPGSTALQGEVSNAKIRIDDDDFLESECSI